MSSARKPTKAELMERTERGGRVFLTDYSDASSEAQEQIDEALSSLPGVRFFQGYFGMNGTTALTFVDNEDELLGKRTDDEIRWLIVAVIQHYWRHQSNEE
jgi:hypothetical protein